MNVSSDYQKVSSDYQKISSDLETGPFKSDPIYQQKQVIPWMHYELLTVGAKYTENGKSYAHMKTYF